MQNGIIFEKVEYSLIARDKLKNLRKDLTARFGTEVSRKTVKKITVAARGLGIFEEKGISVSSMYDIECDYRHLYEDIIICFIELSRSRLL